MKSATILSILALLTSSFSPAMEVQLTNEVHKNIAGTLLLLEDTQRLNESLGLGGKSVQTQKCCIACCWSYGRCRVGNLYLRKVLLQK